MCHTVVQENSATGKSSEGCTTWLCAVGTPFPQPLEALLALVHSILCNQNEQRIGLVYVDRSFVPSLQNILSKVAKKFALSGTVTCGLDCTNTQKRQLN